MLFNDSARHVGEGSYVFDWRGARDTNFSSASSVLYLGPSQKRKKVKGCEKIGTIDFLC